MEAHVVSWSRPDLPGNSVATFDTEVFSVSGTATVGGDPVTPGMPAGVTVPFSGGEFAGTPTTWDANALVVMFINGATLVAPLTGNTE